MGFLTRVLVALIVGLPGLASDLATLRRAPELADTATALSKARRALESVAPALDAPGMPAAVRDDEDGVPTLPAVKTTSTSVLLGMEVLNNTDAVATLACWLDFNRDGDFLDAGERASAAVSSSPLVQTVNLTFSRFAAPAAGVSYLRCRVASVASEVANPTGLANSGEVEDCRLVIAEPTAIALRDLQARPVTLLESW